MQFIIKKLSIIFIIIAFEVNQSKLFAQDKYGFDDFGLISIMYHRFNEDKYPSTNIQLEVFNQQLKIIEEEGISFIEPKNLKKVLSEEKQKRKILFTVDDGLL